MASEEQINIPNATQTYFVDSDVPKLPDEPEEDKSLKAAPLYQQVSESQKLYEPAIQQGIKQVLNAANKSTLEFAQAAGNLSVAYQNAQTLGFALADYNNKVTDEYNRRVDEINNNFKKKAGGISNEASLHIAAYISKNNPELYSSLVNKYGNYASALLDNKTDEDLKVLSLASQISKDINILPKTIFADPNIYKGLGRGDLKILSNITLNSMVYDGYTQQSSFSQGFSDPEIKTWLYDQVDNGRMDLNKANIILNAMEYSSMDDNFFQTVSRGLGTYLGETELALETHWKEVAAVGSGLAAIVFTGGFATPVIVSAASTGTFAYLESFGKYDIYKNQAAIEAAAKDIVLARNQNPDITDDEVLQNVEKEASLYAFGMSAIGAIASLSNLTAVRGLVFKSAKVSDDVAKRAIGGVDNVADKITLNNLQQASLKADEIFAKALNTGTGQSVVIDVGLGTATSAVDAMHQRSLAQIDNALYGDNKDIDKVALQAGASSFFGNIAMTALFTSPTIIKDLASSKYVQSNINKLVKFANEAKELSNTSPAKNGDVRTINKIIQALKDQTNIPDNLYFNLVDLQVLRNKLADNVKTDVDKKAFEFLSKVISDAEGAKLEQVKISAGEYIANLPKASFYDEITGIVYTKDINDNLQNLSEDLNTVINNIASKYDNAVKSEIDINADINQPLQDVGAPKTPEKFDPSFNAFIQREKKANQVTNVLLSNLTDKKENAKADNLTGDKGSSIDITSDPNLPEDKRIQTDLTVELSKLNLTRQEFNALKNTVNNFANILISLADELKVDAVALANEYKPTFEILKDVTDTTGKSIQALQAGTYSRDGRVIRVKKDEDIITIFHEMNHYLFDILNDIADKYPDSELADYMKEQRIKYGVGDKRWDEIDPKIMDEMQEQFVANRILHALNINLTPAKGTDKLNALFDRLLIKAAKSRYIPKEKISLPDGGEIEQPVKFANKADELKAIEANAKQQFKQDYGYDSTYSDNDIFMSYLDNLIRKEDELFQIDALVDPTNEYERLDKQALSQVLSEDQAEAILTEQRQRQLDYYELIHRGALKIQELSIRQTHRIKTFLLKQKDLLIAQSKAEIAAIDLNMASNIQQKERLIDDIKTQDDALDVLKNLKKEEHQNYRNLSSKSKKETKEQHDKIIADIDKEIKKTNTQKKGDRLAIKQIAKAMAELRITRSSRVRSNKTALAEEISKINTVINNMDKAIESKEARIATLENEFKNQTGDVYKKYLDEKNQIETIRAFDGLKYSEARVLTATEKKKALELGLLTKDPDKGFHLNEYLDTFPDGINGLKNLCSFIENEQEYIRNYVEKEYKTKTYLQDNLIKSSLKNYIVLNKRRSRALYKSLFGKMQITDENGNVITNKNFLNYVAQGADARLNMIPVRELSPVKLLRQAQKYRKAFNKAITLEDGNLAKAQHNLLLSQIYETMALQAVNKTEKFIKERSKIVSFYKKGDETLSKNYDIETLLIGRAILGRLKETGSSSKYVNTEEVLKRFAPDKYQELVNILNNLDTFGGLDYLPVGDALTIFEVLNKIKDTAKERKTIILDNEKLYADLTTELDNYEKNLTINKILKKPELEATHSQSLAQKDKKSIRDLVASMCAYTTKFESLIETLDGARQGLFKKVAYEPLREATDKYQAKILETGKKTKALLNKVTEIEKKATVQTFDTGFKVKHRVDGRIVETPLVFGSTKGVSATVEMLGFMAHFGNTSNLGALSRSLGLTDADVIGIISKAQDMGLITKEMWDVTQEVWNIYNSLLDETQDVHYEVTGRYFKVLQNREIVTPYGTYSGGYVPIKVLDRIDTEVTNFEDGSAALVNELTGVLPTMDNFTKERVEHDNKISIDFVDTLKGIDPQLRFICFVAPAKKVDRFFKADKDFLARFEAVTDGAYAKVIDPLLKDLVLQRSAANSSKVGSLIGRTASGFNAFLLCGNLVNIAQTVVNFVPALTRVSPKALVRGASLAYGDNAQEITKMSAFMAGRLQRRREELSEVVSTFEMRGSVARRAHTFLNKLTFAIQAEMQRHIDRVVWWGAYDEAMKKNNLDSEQAIKLADNAVRTTQGSFDVLDASAQERAHPIIKALTPFASYFITMGNLARAERFIANKEFANNSFKRFKSKAYSFLLIYVMSSVVSEWIRNTLTGAFFADDDEKVRDSIINASVISPIKNIAMTKNPIFGSVANFTIDNLVGSGFQGNSLFSIPAADAVAKSMRSITKGLSQIYKDDAPEFTENDTLNIVKLFALPASYIGYVYNTYNLYNKWNKLDEE